MKTVILAGGKSLRAAPIEDKIFVSFFGKPLIQYILEGLLSSGAEDFIFIVNDSNQSNVRSLAKKLGIEGSFHVQDSEHPGMAGAVLSLPRMQDTPLLIVSTNDLIEKRGYSDLLKISQNKGLDGAILARVTEEYFPGGYLKIDSGGIIQEIIEKPGAGREPSDLVNLVVHYHRSSELLQKRLRGVTGDRDDKYELGLSGMFKAGMKYQVVEYQGQWHPFKYPWHVLDIMEYFFQNQESGISEKAEISPQAVIKGEVIIEDGVRIFEGAVVRGPAYIGKNAVVANNALVRESHVGEDSIVGFGTEIARSFLGKGVWTHTNYIGDSIVGNNVSFGSGTVTANLRLDEQEIKVKINGKKIGTGRNKLGLMTGNNVRTGINANFMPAVRIGADSFVGPGIVVNRDIDPQSFVTGKWELVIRKNATSASPEGRDKFRNKI